MKDLALANIVAMDMIAAQRTYRATPQFESCPNCQNPMNFDAMSREYYCRCGATASPLYFHERRRTS